MKLKKFKKKTVVKINSKEDYLLLMELAEKAGWKWLSGHNATYFNDHVDYYNSDYISFITSDKTLARISKAVLDDLFDRYKVITMRQAVKFEVGDKVRIRKDLDELDETEPPKIIDAMLDAAGDECIITNIPPGHKPNWYSLDSVPYCWLKKWLEPVASCHAEEPEQETEEPEQETEEPEQETEEHHEFFTGEVVCTESKNSFTTTGKIYKFVDGISVDDEGRIMPRITRPKSVDELNDMLYSDFIEVVE